MSVTLVAHPLVAEALADLRARSTGDEVFRARLRALGAMLLVEATRDLALAPRPIETPLAAMAAPALVRPLPCLVSVLRAGDGLLAGMLDLLPGAPVGHVGMRRDHATLRPTDYYLSLPSDIAQRLAIVADPMLATAGTAIAAIGRLKRAGAPAIRLLAVVAAPEGLAALAAAHPDVAVFVAALDERLDQRGYIVPGLGDAGDRLFGTG